MAVSDVILAILICVLSLMILCSLSRVVKFYVKLTFYYVAIFSVTTAAIPFSLLHPGDPGNLLYASWMVHHIISDLFGLKWEVKNLELLKSNEPYILVCNHQSALDISGMMYIWPLFHPCVPVLKRELLWSGPFGIFCWLAGCVFVDRFNSEKARDTLNIKIREIKERKVKLWIFPEGTRNDKGTLLPFKKGAFHIATQAKRSLQITEYTCAMTDDFVMAYRRAGTVLLHVQLIPIVPVVFSQYSDFYSIEKKIFDRGTITVTVLPWVDTTGLTADDVPDLSDRVRKMMTACLSKTIIPVERKQESNGGTVCESKEQ